MTKQFVSLFIFLSFFMSGCEDATTKKKTTITQQVSTAQKPSVVKEIKKKPFVTKKVVKNKPSQSEIEEDVNDSGLSNDPQILDLSVPVQYNETVISKESSSDKEVNLLPDLFVDKIKQTDDALQINGNFISREEAEKNKSVDGIGIGIELTP